MDSDWLFFNINNFQFINRYRKLTFGLDIFNVNIWNDYDSIYKYRYKIFFSRKISVSYTHLGDARSKLLEALKAAEKGDFAQAESLVEEAGSCIAEAHKSQTTMLAQEAAGEDLPYSITMMRCV